MVALFSKINFSNLKMKSRPLTDTTVIFVSVFYCRVRNYNNHCCLFTVKFCFALNLIKK